MTNGAYGSRYRDGHRSDRDDAIKDGIFLDTLDRRGSGHQIYSSSSSDRHHGHHCYKPYKRNDKGYFLDEFKKSKPPTFDGKLKKYEYEEASLLGMMIFFELHD